MVPADVSYVTACVLDVLVDVALRCAQALFQGEQSARPCWSTQATLQAGLPPTQLTRQALLLSLTSGLAPCYDMQKGNRMRESEKLG